VREIKEDGRDHKQDQRARKVNERNSRQLAKSVTFHFEVFAPAVAGAKQTVILFEAVVSDLFDDSLSFRREAPINEGFGFSSRAAIGVEVEVSPDGIALVSDICFGWKHGRLAIRRGNTNDLDAIPALEVRDAAVCDSAGYEPFRAPLQLLKA
jgi:hypothetical protein